MKYLEPNPTNIPYEKPKPVIPEYCPDNSTANGTNGTANATANATAATATKATEGDEENKQTLDDKKTIVAKPTPPKKNSNV